MPNWSFVAIQNGQTLGEIAALEPALNFRLTDRSDVSFRINGDHPTALFLSEFVTDILVYRSSVPVFRGTVGSVVDSADGTGYYLRVSAADYRSRLERRILKADVTFTGEDDTDIVADLIGDAQAEASGDMGITVQPDGSPTVRTVTFRAGETVAECVNLLASLDGGFDWDVGPDLVLRTFRRRGQDRGRVLDYGGALRGFTISSDPARFANSVRVSGDALTAQERTDFSTVPSRFETQTGLPLVGDQQVLDDFADRLLEDRLDDWRTFELVLRQSDAFQAWGGLSDIGLGDDVRVVVKAGRLDVNELQRVQQITVTLGEDGREDVRLSVRGPRREFTDRFRELSRRLDALELG